MATKRFILFFIVMFLSSFSILSAQNIQVSGEVTEAGEGPIAGVTVLVRGTSIGTVTGFDGQYTISAPSNGILEFRFLGMETVSTPINGRTTINAELKSESISVDEVVVVGYGTQSARSITASISSVKAEALKDVPSVSVDQMLQGRAAGVSINTPTAAVGQAPTINIRGVGTINSGTNPLYIVDGIPIQIGGLSSTTDANALADINPADILSIDILKDASAAAMYGSRAANGVVLITTKTGSKGAAKLTYDTSFGFSNPTDYIKPMNAEQYIEFKNLAYQNRYGEDAFFPMYDSNNNMIDTDWSDLLYQNGFSQNHVLSVSGGSDKGTYYLSTGYTENNGIVVGDAYERYSLKANTSLNATDWLKVGINTSYSYSTVSAIDGARSNSNFAINGFTRNAIILPPNLPAYREDGTPYYENGTNLGYGNNLINTTYYNPMATIDYGNNQNTYTNRIIGAIFAEVTPVENLTLKTQYGIDWSFVESDYFRNPHHGDGFASGGTGGAYHRKNKIWTWTNTANYKWDIAEDHHFDFLVGMEASETKRNMWGSTRTGLNDKGFDVLETSWLTYGGAGEMYERSMISYFGRLNYDFNYKYMFSANFRRDGYSPLGQKWGNFGGVSAAWRISEEGFFESAKEIFSDLKLKASWGLVGNADVGWYPSKSTYSTSYYGGSSAYLMSAIADPSLKWESSGTYNIGVSATLLNNITVDVDYFYTKSTDLILDVPQSLSTGIPNGSITTNEGEMMNKGLELSVGATLIKTEDFSWDSNFNITFTKNEVLKLTDDILTTPSLETTNITTEGKPIAQLYVYPTGGIDPATGRRIFITPEGNKTYFSYPTWYNEDGSVYNGGFEQVIAGNSLPTYYGGWNNTFRYKAFDMTLFFQFSGGNKIYNGTKATAADMRFWNNAEDVYLNYWTEERTNATYAKPIFGDNYSNGSAYPIGDWVEKGDYLRFKNIAIGYTFNTKSWSKKLGISSLRLYAQAQNIFVITGYTGVDPEISSNVSESILGGGNDKNTLPLARTYTMGLNISF